jgi:hypothetical protein
MSRWASRSGSVIGSGSGLRGAASAEGSVRAVLVVERLVLTQRLEEMGLVPDEGAVEEFGPAGPDPAFNDRVHARYPDAGSDDLDALVGEDGVKAGRVAHLALADQVLHPGSGVVEVHGEVPSVLRLKFV